MKSKKTWAQVLEQIKQHKARSAFDKGVRRFAIDLVESAIERHHFKMSDFADSDEKLFLNGAKDWKQYVDGACGLFACSDIAEALCSPSELKRVKGGLLSPSRNESWIDVAARAYRLAYETLIRNTIIR